MAKKKNISVRQKDINRRYKKERDRVARLVRKAKKEGYINADELLPKIPKKKTEASIRKLSKITSKTFREKLTKELKVDLDTGEILAKDRRRKKKKTQASIPTYDTFYNIRNKILALSRVKYYGYGIVKDYTDEIERLISNLDDAINDPNFESHLKRNEYQINTHMDVIQFDSQQDHVEYAYANLFDIIGIPLSGSMDEYFEE